MDQPLAIGVDHIFQDLEHRPHGKEGIEHQ
jgi:hypothetical protein